ncbi:MAG: CAP domain-containing protein [Hyphomicrobium sp.]|nr:CAP domain-containing protein [Hyphomicrobium sp.]
MYRVLVGVTVALWTTGCSMNSSALTAGFADSPSLSARPTRQASLGGDLDTRPPTRVEGSQRTASLAPSANRPSERAPKGALADRDYSRAALNPEAARDAINNYRRSKGLKPLKLDAELTTAARAHAQDLAKWDRISHYGSDGSNPWDRVKRAGYNAKLAAENVGTGQATFDEVLKGWQNSPGHNKNLLQPEAQHIGLALVHDPKTEFKTFWTLVIGSRL